MSADALLWESGCGRLTLTLTEADAHAGYHSGDCEADILDLMADRIIRDQLDALDPQTVTEYLREFGAWPDDDLADHHHNLMRVLWLACGDLVEAERC
jgi:hypothetical protein